MADLQHLREQAQRCVRLARARSDRVVADRLRLMAADLTEPVTTSRGKRRPGAAGGRAGRNT